MYEGRKHSRSAVLAERKRARTRKRTLLASIALAGVLAVGGTVAYLFTNTAPVANTFAPSEVTTFVDEGTSDGVKSDVRIKNAGNTTAYIRAAVVVTWQDAQGNVYGQAPVSNLENSALYDYTITYDLSNGWVKGDDGFYYWTKPVKSQAEDRDKCFTGVLVESCAPVEGKAPSGYSLNVEVLGSGIQADGEATTTTVRTNDEAVYAEGTEPVVIAWSNSKVKISVDDGTLLVGAVSGE